MSDNNSNQAVERYRIEQEQTADLCSDLDSNDPTGIMKDQVDAENARI